MIQPFACVAVVTNEHGEVLTVNRRGFPNDLGFPGGKREAHETTVACLLRELREETGLEAHSIVFLMEGYDAHGNLVYAFWIRKWTGTPQQKEDGIQVTWQAWAKLGEPDQTFADFNRDAHVAYVKASAV